MDNDDIARQQQNREEEMWRCHLAEEAERYDEMAAVIKKIIELNSELTEKERNFFSVAYRNLIGTHRCSWRMISSLENKTKDSSEFKQKLVKEYRKKIENDLKDVCLEVLVLIDKFLMPKASTPESKFWYLKMTIDYHTYLSEVTTGDEHQRIIKQQHTYDEEARNFLKNHFPPTHPFRLSQALRYSVFCYEMLNQPEQACRVAKEAFDDAIAELDTLDENSYRDSTLLMQLLRDNLTMWTADDQLD